MEKFNDEQKELFRELRKQLIAIEDIYWLKVDELENIAKTNTGLDIEFFHVDGFCVGIGTADRKYKLLQWDELED